MEGSSVIKVIFCFQRIIPYKEPEVVLKKRKKKQKSLDKSIANDIKNKVTKIFVHLD